MTEEQRLALSAAAEDANRLRNDTAFQGAMLSLRAKTLAALEHEKAAVIAAMLKGEPSNIEAVRTRQAELTAIDGLSTEIANAILRAPRKPMAVA